MKEAGGQAMLFFLFVMVVLIVVVVAAFIIAGGDTGKIEEAGAGIKKQAIRLLYIAFPRLAMAHG